MGAEQSAEPEQPDSGEDTPNAAGAGADAAGAAQWFYQRRGEWEPFGGVENAELEDAWLGGRDSVEFGEGRFRAVLPARIQHNHDAGTRRQILRGTWFV